MLKLMKYEFRKTLYMKLILLGTTAAAEAAFLIGLAAGIEDLWAGAVLALVLLAFASELVIGLASLLTLHRDMNTRQGYMLFMTPNSAYRILGAKVLENGISMLLTGAVFAALGALDVSLLFAKMGEFDRLWQMITTFLHSMNEAITLDAPTLLSFALEMLSSWFCLVTAACLGDVISAALLRGRRMNGLVSFLIILALLFLTARLQSLAVRGIHVIRDAFLVQSLIALVLSAVMYFVTARIMDRRLSV